MTGEPFDPGAVTLNWSVVQSPTAPPEKDDKIFPQQGISNFTGLWPARANPLCQNRYRNLTLLKLGFHSFCHFKVDWSMWFSKPDLRVCNINKK
jgi:hypothetical protein